MNIHPAIMTHNKGTLYNGRRLCKLWVELLRQSCSFALFRNGDVIDDVMTRFLMLKNDHSRVAVSQQI